MQLPDSMPTAVPNAAQPPLPVAREPERGASPGRRRMRAVVTGGAGFIGSHLIEALVREGHEVVCVERPGAPQRWIAGLPTRMLRCGLDHRAALVQALEGADVVFHLAGLTSARHAEDFVRVNTLGTERVLQAAAAQAHPPRVILMSSLAATGPSHDGVPLSPDSPPRPISSYGRSKLQAEILVHAYADRVPSTVIRPTSVYGPRDRDVLRLFQMVQRGLALGIGSWDRELHVIYVKDLARGLVAAARSPRAAGRTYVLAHPERLTWRLFVSELACVLERRPLRIGLPRAAAKAVAVAAETIARLRRRPALLNRGRVQELAQRSWACDPQRTIEELDFAPSYPLSRGLRETAAWYREEQWL